MVAPDSAEAAFPRPARAGWLPVHRLGVREASQAFGIYFPEVDR
jgi:hypothetical protein